MTRRIAVLGVVLLLVLPGLGGRAAYAQDPPARPPGASAPPAPKSPGAPQPPAPAAVPKTGPEAIRELLSRGSEDVRRGAYAEAIDRIETALDLARVHAPLRARRFLLVREDAPGFGQYVPRANNVFAPGQEMLFYLEPMNYNFRRRGDLYEAWLQVDVNLLLPEGTVIYGKRNFFEQIFSARSKIHDLFLNLSLEVTGLEEGIYRVEYVVKDGLSGKQATVHQDVVIREPEPVLNP